MVWLLNLKPTAAGTLKPSQTVENGSGANTVLTTAVMADIPVLTSLITRLFESSNTMDIVALHHVINGLCALSNDAMQISAEGREPSFFAVSKLMEITLFNLHRADQFFKPVSSHFVEVKVHTDCPLNLYKTKSFFFLFCSFHFNRIRNYANGAVSRL